MIDFEGQFTPRKRKSRGMRGNIYYPHTKHLILTEPGDSELGIFPLIAAAIPMVTSLAGSLLSKKGKKGGGPPPEAAQAQNVLDMLTKAVGGDEGKGETNIKEVVKNLIKSIPPPVMAQVKDGIKQIKNAEASAKGARDALIGGTVGKIDAKFGPQIHALLAGLRAAQMQTQATHEHNVLAAEKNFKSGTTNTLDNVAKRLTRIEKRLGGVAVVPPGRINLFGGRDALQRGA